MTPTTRQEWWELELRTAHDAALPVEREVPNGQQQPYGKWIKGIVLIPLPKTRRPNTASGPASQPPGSC